MLLAVYNAQFNACPFIGLPAINKKKKISALPGRIMVQQSRFASCTLSAAPLGKALAFALAAGPPSMPLQNSAITWVVPPQEMGDALGVSSALESLSRVIAPTLGGWLLGAVGAWAPGVLAAILMACLAPYAWQRLIVRPEPPLGEAVWLESGI